MPSWTDRGPDGRYLNDEPDDEEDDLVKPCSLCGRPIYQKHAETCVGPPRRECTCPPGWKHEPGCVEVTG